MLEGWGRAQRLVLRWKAIDKDQVCDAVVLFILQDDNLMRSELVPLDDPHCNLPHDGSLGTHSVLRHSVAG